MKEKKTPKVLPGQPEEKKTAELLPIQPEEKHGMAQVYAEILSKQMDHEDSDKIGSAGFVSKLKNPAEIKKMNQSSKFRPTNVDVNHRFGRRAGSK